MEIFVVLRKYFLIQYTKWMNEVWCMCACAIIFSTVYIEGYIWGYSLFCKKGKMYMCVIVFLPSTSSLSHLKASQTLPHILAMPYWPLSPHHFLEGVEASLVQPSLHLDHPCLNAFLRKTNTRVVLWNKTTSSVHMEDNDPRANM